MLVIKETYILPYTVQHKKSIPAMMNLMISNTIQTVIILLFFFFFTNNVSSSYAYRQGDAIGILLKVHTPSSGSQTLEAYRHQLPRFGVSTKTRFDISTLLNADDIRLSSEEVDSKQQQQQPRKKSDDEKLLSEHLRLSIAFDEGYHHIPWLDVYNPTTKHDEKIMLDNLLITIVYSGSDGSIHAIHREAKYLDTPIAMGGSRRTIPKQQSFTVEYIWINEADVDVQGGLMILFVAVLIVSLSGMLGSCMSSSSDDEYFDGSSKRRYKEKRSSSLLGGDDGFAKSL